MFNDLLSLFKVYCEKFKNDRFILLQNQPYFEQCYERLRYIPFNKRQNCRNFYTCAGTSFPVMPGKVSGMLFTSDLRFNSRRMFFFDGISCTVPLISSIFIDGKTKSSGTALLSAVSAFHSPMKNNTMTTETAGITGFYIQCTKKQNPSLEDMPFCIWQC